MKKLNFGFPLVGLLAVLALTACGGGDDSDPYPNRSAQAFPDFAPGDMCFLGDKVSEAIGDGRPGGTSYTNVGIVLDDHHCSVGRPGEYGIFAAHATVVQSCLACPDGKNKVCNYGTGPLPPPPEEVCQYRSFWAGSATPMHGSFSFSLKRRNNL